MARYRGAFQLYRRSTSMRKNGKPVYVFYYRVWQGNTRTPGRSTGQTSRSAARSYVEGQLAAGTLRTGPDPTLREYTESWWTDECRYVRRKRERGGLSEGYIRNERSFLDTWILPYLGDRRLGELTPRAVEDWLYKLRDESDLSATSVNHCLTGLKIITREAVRIGDLARDPCATVEPLHETRRVKGILEREQIKALFDLRILEEVWANDTRVYTLNLFAATTGARMGECQALQRQHVHEGWVAIEHGWRKLGGLAEPKRASRRKVPLPAKTEAALEEVMALSPWQDPEDLVFAGKDGRTPFGSRYIHDTYCAALRAIGLTEDQRRAAGLSFHSWRVFYNSLLRGQGIGEAKLRMLTGHKSEAMSDLYTRWDPKDFEDVRKLGDGLFGEARDAQKS